MRRREPQSKCLTAIKQAVAAAASGAGTERAVFQCGRVLASGVPGTYTLNFPIPCLAIKREEGAVTGPALLWVWASFGASVPRPALGETHCISSFPPCRDEEWTSGSAVRQPTGMGPGHFAPELPAQPLTGADPVPWFSGPAAPRCSRLPFDSPGHPTPLGALWPWNPRRPSPRNVGLIPFREPVGTRGGQPATPPPPF